MYAVSLMVLVKHLGLRDNGISLKTFMVRSSFFLKIKEVTAFASSLFIHCSSRFIPNIEFLKHFYCL